MPVVDVLVVRALETGARQTQGLDVVAGTRAGHVRIDMGDQGDHAGGARLAAQEAVFLQAQRHDGLPGRMTHAGG